ncbi:hypothetical protein J2Y68_003286 [Paenarthrobacter nitroguajacolicus]|nr:hypothetical protein [Paenarthrobacter nitroguajacolicus]
MEIPDARKPEAVRAFPSRVIGWGDNHFLSPHRTLPLPPTTAPSLRGKDAARDAKTYGGAEPYVERKLEVE